MIKRAAAARTRSGTRAFHPALLGVALVKKAGAVALARKYGFNRVYRRAMEVNRRRNGYGTQEYVAVSVAAREILRAPGRALEVLENNTGALRVLADLDRRYSESKHPLVGVAYMLAKSTPLYSWIKEVQAVEAAARRARKTFAPPHPRK